MNMCNAFLLSALAICCCEVDRPTNNPNNQEGKNTAVGNLNRAQLSQVQPSFDGKVILLNNGGEPRVKLRYTATVGHQIAAKRTKTAKTPNSKYPELRTDWFYHVKVIEADSDKLKLEYNLDITTKKSSYSATVAAIFTNTGKLVSWNIEKGEGRTGFDPKLQQHLVSIINATWLPEEPVGVGAEWRIASKAGSEGLGRKANRIVHMKLIENNNGRIKISRRSDVQFEPQITPGNRKLLHHKTLVTGSIELDLSGPVSIVARQSSQSGAGDYKFQKADGTVVRSLYEFQTDETVSRRN